MNLFLYIIYLPTKIFKLFNNIYTRYELKKIEPKLTNEVLEIFNLKNSVNSKKSYGGTSFDNIRKMIIKYKRN